MKNYLLSILGITILGVLIDIVVPCGKINKYIKGVYSIFVVYVLLVPLTSFLNVCNFSSINYDDYEIDDKIVSYIYSVKVEQTKNDLNLQLKQAGIENVDIIINYSVEDNQICYNSCQINLTNMVNNSDKLNINIYEYIKDVVKKKTNLAEEEIFIYE